MFRTKWYELGIHFDEANRRLPKRDNSSKQYPTTIITVAVIILTLIVFLIMVTISRLCFLRHRRFLIESGAIPMQSIYGTQHHGPDISAPQVYVRKIDRFVYAKPRETTNSWADTQPLSLVLDPNPAGHMHPSHTNPVAVEDCIQSQSNNVSPSIQASFLVSLPSSKSIFPSHLRRRNQPQDENLAQTSPSKSLEVPLHTQNSIKDEVSATVTEGDQRRDATIDPLERSNEEQTAEKERAPSVRSTSSTANQERVERNGSRVANNENAEELGSFGLGTISFALSMPGTSRENGTIPTAELTRILDLARRNRA